MMRVDLQLTRCLNRGAVKITADETSADAVFTRSAGLSRAGIKPRRMLLFLFSGLLCIAWSSAVFADEMTSAEKAQVLDAFNQTRADVANGVAAPLPTATNMAKFVWDSDLEAVAQAWANNCTYSINPNRTVEYQALGGSATYVGEDVYAQANDSNVATNAVAAWVAEQSDYTYSPYDGSSGHFTQVIWANTRRVGCAEATCPGILFGSTDQFVVCDYAEGGNYLGQYPYESGPTASNCPVDLPSVENGLCIEASATPVPALGTGGTLLLVAALLANGSLAIVRRHARA